MYIYLMDCLVDIDVWGFLYEWKIKEWCIKVSQILPDYIDQIVISKILLFWDRLSNY